MTLMDIPMSLIMEGSGTIQSKAAEMRSELDSFDRKIKERLWDTWDGAAKTAYLARQGEWTKAADNIEQILLRWMASLTQSHDGYDEGERANISTLSA